LRSCLTDSWAEHHAPPMTKLPTMTSEELRAIRAEMGANQREAAEMLGVTLRGYTRWESGDRSIPGPAVLLFRFLLREHRESQKKSP